VSACEPLAHEGGVVCVGLAARGPRQVGVQRPDQLGFVRFRRVMQPLQLLAAELERSGCPRVKELLLLPDKRRETVHLRLRPSGLGLRLVKV